MLRDGVEAVEYLLGTGAYAGRDATVQPQVVFLDLKLPKLNGLDVLKRLREDPRTKMVQVVVLTTSQEEGDMVVSYKSGRQQLRDEAGRFCEVCGVGQAIGALLALVESDA